MTAAGTENNVFDFSEIEGFCVIPSSICEPLSEKLQCWLVAEPIFCRHRDIIDIDNIGFAE
jgi:hypothetical protein